MKNKGFFYKYRVIKIKQKKCTSEAKTIDIFVLMKK